MISIQGSVNEDGGKQVIATNICKVESKFSSRFEVRKLTASYAITSWSNFKRRKQVSSYDKLIWGHASLKNK
jgi:hypothetical protein